MFGKAPDQEARRREIVISNLRGINLNLLPVLRELLRKRNVTHAAAALNMSQPAVSEALGRLRHIFHDEILVQSGRVMVLTAFAERLAPVLEAALGEVEAMIAPNDFDPALAHGTIKIATASYVVLLCGSYLSLRLAEQAPNLELEFVESQLRSDSDLRLGQIDFMITPAGGVRPAMDAFESMSLFEDDFVCLVAASAPKQKLDVASINSRRHVVVSTQGASNSFSMTLLKRAGVTPSQAVRVADFLSIPFMIEETNNIALVQRRLAQRLLPSARVRIEELPFPGDPLRMMALWSYAKNQDPVHRWFRGVLSELADHIQGVARGDAAQAPANAQADRRNVRKAKGRLPQGGRSKRANRAF